jgi:hypothetical protein
MPLKTSILYGVNSLAIRLSINLFTIPAMSDEPERTFGSCSLMIRSHRGSLESDVVEFT